MPFASVSIIGCGWLGLPLAEILARQGYRVNGSTTTLEKIPVLQKAGIFPFLLQVDASVRGEGVKDFFDTDIVVITLPFRRSFTDPHDYRKQVDAVLAQCKNVPSLIFTSSTSVYPDNIGSAAEELDFKPDNERSKVLRQVEKHITARKGIVVRFSGLYGGTRKIGAFLSGKKEFSGGDSPVNLIHQDDAVGILQKVIEQREKLAGEIFNGCSDAHPTKKVLYTAAAKKMNLAPPQFIEEKNSVKKIVVNEKVKKVLGYKFLHPDPLKNI
ncbi:MAG: SDR family oxidoreductase [Candidatus Omnitrophica bacterium]|nr:SDR family oxidoreductase [Candidatus Omnitrophota bacterium]